MPRQQLEPLEQLQQKKERSFSRTAIRIGHVSPRDENPLYRNGRRDFDLPQSSQGAQRIVGRIFSRRYLRLTHKVYKQTAPSERNLGSHGKGAKTIFIPPQIPMHYRQCLCLHKHSSNTPSSLREIILLLPHEHQVSMGVGKSAIFLPPNPPVGGLLSNK